MREAEKKMRSIEKQRKREPQEIRTKAKTQDETKPKQNKKS